MRCAVKTGVPDFAGIVLAGGASSRMGCDKTALRIAGRSLLTLAVETLSAAGAKPVIVSGLHVGFDCVPDQTPGQGPLGGLASVLAARPELCERLLIVLPVDTPRVTPTAVRALAHAAVARPGAFFQDHPLPLAVWVTPALIRYLRALREDGGPVSVRRLAKALAIAPAPRRGIDLTNVNTPDDWHRLLAASGLLSRTAS